MQTLALRALKPLIVVLFLGGLLGQALIIPFAAYSIAVDVPHVAAGLLYGAAGIAAVACVEVALVAMWKLLTMVGRDAIFSRDAFRWVDLIVTAGWVASALCFAIAAYHAVFMPFGPPSTMLFLLGCLAGAVAITLLMTVMRRILESAMTYRAELAEVI
jgi:hypothetical protein